MTIDNKHTYKLCMKYYLLTNSYKHYDGVNVWGYIWQKLTYRQAENSDDVTTENNKKRCWLQ
jgi:hypothetical protein